MKTWITIRGTSQHDLFTQEGDRRGPERDVLVTYPTEIQENEIDPGLSYRGCLFNKFVR